LEILRRPLLEVRSKLQQVFAEVSTRVKGVTAMTSLENETAESKRTLYLFSLALLISLVLLAPDKIPQTFAPSQASTDIFEKAQEIIKKLIPTLS